MTTLIKFALLTVALLMAAPRVRADDPPTNENPPAWRFALSPVAGVDRNELRRPAGPHRLCRTTCDGGRSKISSSTSKFTTSNAI